MPRISQQELERRVKQAAARMGYSGQQQGITGRKRLNSLNLGDIDTRHLGLGGGRYQKQDEVEPFTPPEISEPESPTMDEVDMGEVEGEGLGVDDSITAPSEMSKSLGHTGMPGSYQSLLGKTALNTIANMYGVPVSMVSPTMLATFFAKSLGTGIGQASMEGDVSDALGLLGIDPESEEAQDVIGQAMALNTAKFGDVEDENSIEAEEAIDPTAISHMTDQPTPVDEISDVMADNENKSAWAHLSNFFSHAKKGMSKSYQNMQDDWADQSFPTSLADLSETMEDTTMEDMGSRLGHLGLDAGPKGSVMGYSDEGDITGPTDSDSGGADSDGAYNDESSSPGMSEFSGGYSGDGGEGGDDGK